ncbi:MAG TPA: D-alanyl-D-alanine carboxypeptidase/D-alanyl-D-alanine-endopeptidase [Steroidobacteraceae bacterium]|nr:D-alanyl-D-alanine carboxypeptidase/D-alanyl-D-alanine-endopeptidase [Steroidobacteraceae bacterium]
MDRLRFALDRIIACAGVLITGGVLIVGGVLMAGGAGAAEPVPAALAQVILAQRLPLNSVSFVILDPDTGHVVLSHNPDTPRSPASTIKTVTTYAALDMLGPAFIWQTRAFTHDGDLILQGGGDPYITLERWWSFVQGLRAQGLKSIARDIVIDDGAFSLPAENPAAFDGRPNRSYNVVPDALMVNFQSIDFTLAADTDTHRVQVTATPAPVNLDIENHIRFAPGRCSGAAARVDFKVASPEWDRVVFSGALSPHCAQRTIARVLLRPASYAFGTFVELWRESGGEFSGKLRLEPTPADATPILSFDSLSLAEIVRLTNKHSNNLMARHLFLTLGRERYGNPATLEKGAAAIEEWSLDRGLDLSGVDFDNGSGLSRSTRISVLQMAKILSAAYRSRFAPEYLASFPLAGMDGTLRSRMKSAAPGSVRLKTGHLDGVSGVAGYVTTPAGRSYVLVSLVNNVRADGGAAEPVHAALVAWIQAKL